MQNNNIELKLKIQEIISNTNEAFFKKKTDNGLITWNNPYDLSNSNKSLNLLELMNDNEIDDLKFIIEDGSYYELYMTFIHSDYAKYMNDELKKAGFNNITIKSEGGIYFQYPDGDIGEEDMRLYILGNIKLQNGNEYQIRSSFFDVELFTFITDLEEIQKKILS